MLRTLVITFILVLFFGGFSTPQKAKAANFQALWEAISLLFTDFSDYQETYKSTFTLGLLESSACNTQDKYAVMAAQRDILNFLMTHYRGVTDQQLAELLNTYRKYELELVFLQYADTINQYFIGETQAIKDSSRKIVFDAMVNAKVIESKPIINQYLEEFLKNYRTRFDESPKIRGEYATCEGPYQEVKNKIEKLKELAQISYLTKSLDSKWSLIMRKVDNIKDYSVKEHYEKIFEEDMKNLTGLFDTKKPFSERAKPFFDYQETLDRFKQDEINKNNALNQGLVVKSEELAYEKIINSNNSTQLQKAIDGSFDITNVQTALKNQDIQQAKTEGLQDQKIKHISELFYKGSYGLQSLLKYKEATAFSKQINQTVEESQTSLEAIDKKQCQ